MANYKRTMRPGTLIAAAFVALTGTQCNKANCEDIRDELYLTKLDWETCNKNDDCIIIGGNGKDCSGVMTCDLAINKARRQEAERRIISLPEETVDCIQCASPNCPQGDLPVCDGKSKKCMIMQEELDGGSLSMSYGAPPSHTGGSGSLESEETPGGSVFD